MTLAICALRLMRAILYYTLMTFLLISPSVTNLERLLYRCEHELAWLDMSINLKKNHPVYVSALAVMQRVLSLLVLQVAAYHGWRKCGPLCQIKVAQMLVGRGQARIFSCH